MQKSEANPSSYSLKDSLMRLYSFPTYTTQGGGIARFQDNNLVFVIPPENFPNYKEGDLVPTDWSFAPTNWDLLKTT